MTINVLMTPLLSYSGKIQFLKTSSSWELRSSSDFNRGRIVRILTSYWQLNLLVLLAELASVQFTGLCVNSPILNII